MAYVARSEGDVRNLPLRLPACCNSPGEIGIVRNNQDTRLAQRGAYPFCRLRLEFFGFFHEREQPLGANSEVHSSLGIFRALCLLDAALKIGNFISRENKGRSERALVARSFPSIRGPSEQRSRDDRPAQV